MLERITATQGDICKKCRRRSAAGAVMYRELADVSKPYVWELWCEACGKLKKALEDDGGPANPDSIDWQKLAACLKDAGVTMRVDPNLRAWAATLLKVPESHIEWLDAMIRESRRDELAGMALQGMLAGEMTSGQHGKSAYEFADEMLTERRKGSDDDGT